MDVVFFPADKTGCGWYRCRLPAAALAAAGVNVRVIEEVEVSYRPVVGDVTAITKIHNFGAVTIVQTASVVDTAIALGMRIIIELDDDFWALPPHNPVTPIMRAVNGIPRLTRACQLAEAVIVSTPILANRVRRETGQRNIVVIPNAVNPAQFTPCPLPPDAYTRVGWAGGSSHLLDFMPILPALARLADDPRVQLHLFGVDMLPATIPHDYHGWCDDILEHYRRIAILDVALAPLINDRFNRSKSYVKWLEHAMYGTPMVLATAGPYATVPAACALHASSVSDWQRQLRRLVHDPILRRDIGQAAQATALAQHTIDQRVPLYREVLGV